MGADDKRQITSVFAIKPLGDFLAPQLIHQGTTTKCLPNVHFPHGFDVTCTENHWLNECTMERYLDKILPPISPPQEQMQNGCYTTSFGLI